MFSRKVLQKLADVLTSGETHFLLTRLTGAKKGEKILYNARGECLMGTTLPQTFIVSPQVPTLIYVADEEYFVEAVENNPEILILGAGHVSRSIADILEFIDCQVTVVDDRAEFLQPGYFSISTKLVHAAFANLNDKVDIKRYKGIVIVTRAHEFDAVCLRQLRPFLQKYIGIIGSKKRIFHVLSALASEGWTQAELDSIYGPIGLDIGAETPEEIAISIVSEYLAVTQGKISSASLKHTRGIWL